MKKMIPALFLVFTSSVAFSAPHVLNCANQFEQNISIARDYAVGTVESTLTTPDLTQNFTGTMDRNAVITMNPTAANERVALSVIRSVSRGGGCKRCGDGGMVSLNAQLVVGETIYTFVCEQ